MGGGDWGYFVDPEEGNESKIAWSVGRRAVGTPSHSMTLLSSLEVSGFSLQLPSRQISSAIH